jgi:hypothetical protein
MNSTSKITQIVSRSTRKVDGTRGPLAVFFMTEDHLAGYEVTDKEIDSCQSAHEPGAKAGDLLAELVFRLGGGELEFAQPGNRIRTLDGTAWVGFTSVQKRQESTAALDILSDL